MQVWTNSDYNGEVDDLIYNIVETKDTLNLTTTSTSEWIEAGQLMASLTDDGNGVTILMDGIELCLDYMQAQQILILLMANSNDKINLVKAETIKSL